MPVWSSRRVYTMRQKHATMRHAMCVKIALCKRAYCDMRLSQESCMISTFLRQHATVACRTNKPVYTAQFCRMSHQFCRIVHVNAPSEWACILLYDILTFYSIPIFILRHSNSATRSNWLSLSCVCLSHCLLFVDVSVDVSVDIPREGTTEFSTWL